MLHPDLLTLHTAVHFPTLIDPPWIVLDEMFCVNPDGVFPEWTRCDAAAALRLWWPPSNLNFECERSRLCDFRHFKQSHYLIYGTLQAQPYAEQEAEKRRQPTISVCSQLPVNIYVHSTPKPMSKKVIFSRRGQNCNEAAWFLWFGCYRQGFNRASALWWRAQ